MMDTEMDNGMQCNVNMMMFKKMMFPMIVMITMMTMMKRTVVAIVLLKIIKRIMGDQTKL